MSAAPAHADEDVTALIDIHFSLATVFAFFGIVVVSLLIAWFVGGAIVSATFDKYRRRWWIVAYSAGACTFFGLAWGLGHGSGLW